VGIKEGFKLAIGIQEYDFFAKPGKEDTIEILVTHENGSFLAKAQLQKSGMFIIYESTLNPLEQLGIEKLLEVGKSDIKEAVVNMGCA